ncbi:Transcriptional regulatory protein WalR [Luteitalea pratensis]|uniref:Phosphate regulon transcriptional regulatory protein PhoB n=1 Tax=Luteitalea pratensis TaxID=1855912 RepID=A0A143PPG6_LUTPR|nr:response regulator transcription factor [Luteitalea pratensis]AMY09714.1 Transcriptional regulatory protein WalR [Luteitalea pratensis]
MTEVDARRALVVEDDVAIRELLQLHLGLAGFDVEEEANGRSALELARRTRFDLLVLDVMLPGLDGVSVCRALRIAGANIETPILMLTARDSEADTVIGLESGADDYLTKPFGVRELQARVLAVTRRHGRGETIAPPDEGPAVLAPGVTMDLAQREVRIQGEPVELTRQEFDLLHHLASHRGIVFSRTRLLETAWTNDTDTERTVDTVVSRLRKKLERDPRKPELILTAWGVGYKFADCS